MGKSYKRSKEKNDDLCSELFTNVKYFLLYSYLALSKIYGSIRTVAFRYR